MIAGLFGFLIYMAFAIAEKIYSVIAVGQYPNLASTAALRDAVVREIKTHYPNMKTACDIGAGYGGLARRIAKECDMHVLALENMLFSSFASKALDALTRSKSKTIKSDAFEYLKKSERFDIAVAYLGPGVNAKLADLKGKARVLIALVAPVPGLKPARTIDLPSGWTRYSGARYPHRLFVYEF